MKNKIGIIIIFLFSLSSLKIYASTDTNLVCDYVFSITKAMLDDDKDLFGQLVGVDKTIDAYEKYGISKEESMKSTYELMINDSEYYINVHLESFNKLGRKIRQEILLPDNNNLRDSFQCAVIGKDYFYGLELLEIRVSLKCMDGTRFFDFVIAVQKSDLFIPIPIPVLGQLSPPMSVD